jgi:thioredoxin:protein disulfide reductase
MKPMTKPWQCTHQQRLLTLVIAAVCTFSMAAFAQDLTAKLTGKPSNGAMASGSLLEPTAAFKPQLRQLDPFTAELKFDIAPGYYLYQGRIQVEHIQANVKPITSGKKATVIRPVLAQSPPVGKQIDDPTFGNVTVYENVAAIPLDLLRFGTSRDQTIQLAVISQGCSKAGVCFPAYEQRFSLNLKPKNTQPSAWVMPNPKAIRLGAPPQPASKPTSKPAPAKPTAAPVNAKP